MVVSTGSTCNCKLPLFLYTEISEQFPNGTRVVFDVLKNNKLLTADRLANENRDRTEFKRLTNSRVISATVGNRKISGLENPIRMTFSPIQVRYLYLLMTYLLTAHNWQKWKRVFLTCPCHEIYRVESVGLKTSNYTLKDYDFCEYVKFGAISWKFDILSITA